MLGSSERTCGWLQNFKNQSMNKCHVLQAVHYQKTKSISFSAFTVRGLSSNLIITTHSRTVVTPGLYFKFSIWSILLMIFGNIQSTIPSHLQLCGQQCFYILFKMHVQHFPPNLRFFVPEVSDHNNLYSSVVFIVPWEVY